MTNAELEYVTRNLDMSTGFFFFCSHFITENSSSLTWGRKIREEKKECKVNAAVVAVGRRGRIERRGRRRSRRNSSEGSIPAITF